MSSTTPDAIAVGFARVLRGAGLRVPTDSVLAFVDALGKVGVGNVRSVYWAGRATLIRRPDDISTYDRAFGLYFIDDGGQLAVAPTDSFELTLAVDDEGDDANDDRSADEPPAEERPTITLRFSAAEVLRHKDFAEYTDSELRDAHDLMARLRLAGPPRRSFRHRRVPRGRRPDLPATLRSSLRTGGEPIDRRWTRPGDRLRRLVLLVDISGSMEPYARALLRFVHAAVAGRQRVEAFAMGTRLTRMTKELGARDPDAALALAATRVHDWSGGTRLGDCLRAFNDQWGVRGMARGAIVVILSDGWDRGDPALLGEQMERLHRVAHRIVWVNPLKVTPGYAPLARGMAAALPHVDRFVEGHSLAAMQDLARVIAEVPA